MVRHRSDVEPVLDAARGRVGVGILIETNDAVAQVAEFSTLPLSRVYAGLNDLAIERRSSTIFAAVADGTVERLRRQIARPFGFGGLTVPDEGHPVPCRLLMGEMARLASQFAFLRRSFHRAVRNRPLKDCVLAIRAGLAAAWSRDRAAVLMDREALVRTVEATYA
jgi:hypothetical protein